MQKNNKERKMEDIVHLEYLSKLKFTDAERESFENEFKNIIAFVDEIANLELEDEVDKDKAISINELRADEECPSISQEEALQNAPIQKDGCYVTPLVVD